VIFPLDRRHEEGHEKWRAVEDLGFHAAYT
jgi:hypothetical protein